MRVLVTGASGYVAGRIVEQLLERGCEVHATVRDPDQRERFRHLDDLAGKHPGTLRTFGADLLDAASFTEAMAGCEVVFHTASPFSLYVRDPQKDLVEPAVLGTRHVLGTANRTASVKRVIVTSSCAAIYGDNLDLQNTRSGRFTEADWNTTSTLQHQPYYFSKTMAEREAWKLAEGQDRWDLVTINPSLVIGPGVNPKATSESFALMKQFGDGTLKLGVPDFGVGVVDVRDVATAHVAAAFTPAARGRYLVSGHDTRFPELAAILRERFGDRYPFPKRTLPKPLVWLVAPLFDKAITRKIVARNVGFPFRADASKGARELGLNYRPLGASVAEFFQQLIDSGAVSARD